jgi:eukaryotic-like serine/threonine-protein kinase
MQLGCVKCGGAFDLTAADMDRGVAICPHCGTRYRARRPENPATATPPQPLPTPPPTTPLPPLAPIASPLLTPAPVAPPRSTPPRVVIPSGGPPHLTPTTPLQSAPPPSQGQFSPGLMIADRYRVERFIAQGGMGEVYEVQDLELGENIALKTLRHEAGPGSTGQDDQALDRLRREIQLARRVTHPNVSRLFDVGYHRTPAGVVPFITMEFLRGETLADRLLRDGRMSTDEALPIARQIADGLSAAHKAGIVHRDLKSANVFLCPDTNEPSGIRAVVTDFGVARSREEQTRLTVAGSVLGTPAYMAPEQLMDAEPTPASDLYAYGLVLYEMVTGKLPFQSETAISTALKRLTQPPEPPRSVVPDLPRRWEQVILRCLEQKPEDRFKDSIEAANALADQRTMVVIPTRAAKRRRTSLYVLVGLFALAAATAVLRIRGLSQAGRDITVAPRKAVAVLGFQNATARPEVGWMGTAIAEMMTTELSAGLRTTPLDTVARARRELGLGDATPALDRAQLGRVRSNLGVDYFVVGAYTAVGSSGATQVRLDLRLLDAMGGESLLQVAENGGEADLFRMVGALGGKVRERLGIAKTEKAGLLSAERWTPEATRLYAEGVARLRAFDAQGARETLERAVAADPQSAHAHGALSEAWTALGYPQRAREEARRAFELAQDLAPAQRDAIEARFREGLGDWARAADLYRGLYAAAPDDLATALRYVAALTAAGRWEEAEATLATLEKLPPPAGQDPRIALAGATEASARGDYRRQLEKAQAAVRGSEAIGAKLLVAQARIAEAWAQRNLGRPNDAEIAAESARSIYADQGDRAGETQALLAQAGAAFDRGDLAAAAQRAEAALARAREVSDSSAIAAALNAQAVAARNQGNLKQARELYGQALGLAKETADRASEALILGNLGTILIQQGQLAAAGSQLDQALVIWKELGDASGEASVLAARGLLLERRGYFVDSKAAYEQALALRRQSGQKAGELVALNGLGRVALALGDLAGARRGFQEALDGCRQASARGCAARALAGLGDVALQTGDVPQARTRHEDALKSRTEAGESLGAAESRFALAQVLLAEGKSREAQVAAGEAAVGLEAQEARDLAGLARAFEVRAALAAGNRGAAKTLYDAGRSAWGASESASVRAAGDLARARVLAAAGSRREAASAAETAAATPGLPLVMNLEARMLATDYRGDRAAAAAVAEEARKAGLVKPAG